MKTVTYTLRVYCFNGRPTAEVLIDGQPFGQEYDWMSEHFSFGLSKAKLVVEAMDFIENFVDDYDNILHAPHLSKERQYNNCFARIDHDFQRLPNTHFPLVYLSNRDHPDDKGMKFGKNKAEVIVELKNEIKAFIERYQGKLCSSPEGTIIESSIKI